MINNYDSVVTCNSSGATNSQEQGETSFTRLKRSWVSLITVFVALFSIVFVQGQTTLINPTGDGGFENGSTLSSNGWTAVSGTTDGWAVGAVPVVSAGSNCGYVSTNGGTAWAYSQLSTFTHIYKDVTIPIGETILTLKFKWKAKGEGTTTSDWDNMRVFIAPTTVTPSTTAAVTGATNLIGPGATNGMYKLNDVAWNSETISFSGLPGTTYRLIFSWKSDVTDIANPPAALDEISLISRVPIAPDAPITFSATAISQNGMTINWVDNSTNETAFRVYRSTDNITFTQIGANVASTTSAGTGTAYNSVQTGLSAGTLYYYKIVALLDAESAPLTGSETTLNGATYYWVGTSTSAAPAPFATVTNWNTSADGSGSTPTALANSDTYIVDGDGSTTTGGNVFISVAAATTVGQLKVISNTTLSLESATTATRTITISGGPGDDFVVENGSSLSLLNATKAAAIAFSGSGNVGSIAGTINFAGSTSNVITTTGGTGTVVTVASTGVINLGVAGNSLVGSVATLSFAAGSNCNSTGATTGAPPVPLATWDTTSTLTISGLTTSTTAPTNNNQSFGNIVYNCPLSTATLNFFGSNSQTIKGNLTITAAGATGGTGIFRATSTGTLTVNGNILISQGRFQAATTTGTVIANGNTTIDANGILDLSTTGIGGLSQRGTTLTNNGIITGTSGTLSFVNLTGSAAQTLAGSGTVLTNIATLSMQNTAGLTITHTNPIIVARVNLFQGTITNSNKITFGTGAAVNCTTQIGSAGLTTPGGSFDAAPTFNLGTGTYTLLYQQESVARTTGFEIPATRTVNSVTVNNTNGVTLAGGNLTALTTLTLTSGIVTTGTNTLQLGDAATVGTLTGGSDTAYVNGAFTRSIANANTNTTYIPFPIGKSGVYTPIALAPATTSIALFKTESFGSNTGTEDPSIIGLSATRRFEALPVSGTFTDINVRLSDAGIIATNIPVQAPSATGAYATAFGSTATFVAGPPITLTSNFSATSANYTGYLSYANSNTCSGTPAPGNTIPSTNAICLGQSVNLSIQTIPAGSGITYQWKSSTDGTTYTAISGATNATLTVTPLVVTYYVCDVTCATGAATGTSTAVQITFSNSVTASTPATRCGTGTVDLAATASAGATIKWYAAANGGTSLATGNNFTTPSIAATTTYYAGAESSTPGSATIGNGTTLTGATAQPSAFVNRWPSYRIQTLYTAAELNAAGLGAGNITSMAYFTTTLGDGATNSNFTVKIGTSTQTSMTTTWVPTTSFATVYGPVTHTHTASGEQPINFTTPFNWDGVTNIVIEVMYNGADITNNAITYFTATTGNMVVHSDSSGSSATTGTVTTTRLNLKLNGQVACSSGRMPVVATVTAPPALTLSSTAATICEASVTPVVTLTSPVSNYNTYVWLPAAGVSGDENAGWTFNPAVSTTYTLTATQTSGNLCVTTTTFAVTVNPRPSVMTITPATGSVCQDVIQSLVVTGGIVGGLTDGQIGTATTLTGATSQPTAFCNRFDHYWVQMVYTAAELTAAGVQPGNITALRFTTGAQGSANNVTDFKVRLGNTSNTTLTGFTTSGLTQVFSVATYATVVGVNTITFDTPYVWDGTSNIIVDMRQTGIDSINNTTTAYTATTDNKTVYAITSTPNAGGSDGFVSTAPIATTSLNRLNTTFVWDSSIPTTITWSPVTNLFTDAAATTAYVDGANASTVYFKSSTPAAAVTYTATSTTNLGCVRTKTVDVTVNPLPTVVTVAPAAVCAGTTVDLTAAAVTTGSDAGLTYTYFTNMQATTAVTTPAAVTTSGIYYIKGTNANGCSTVTAVTVTINPLPVVVVTNPATVCSPNTVDITAATVTTGSDTGLTFTYFTDMAATTALATPAAVTTSGTYYIKAENANGCVKITPVTVTVNPLPIVVTVAPAAVCVGETVDLTAATVTTGSDAGLTFTYFTDDTATTALATPAAVTTSGTYYIKGTNANGCSKVASVTVTVNPLPTVVTVAPAAVCAGTTVDLTAAAVTTGSDAGLTYTYFTNMQATTAVTTPAAVTTSGIYYIKGTNANGCSTVTAVTVTINPLPVVVVTNPATVCSPNTVDITAATVTTGSDTGLTFTYFTDMAATTALATPAAVTTSGTYYIKAENANGCVKITPITVTVNVTPAPTAAATQTFCGAANLSQLAITGTGIKLYTAATAGTEYTASLWPLIGLVNGTTYYASQTLNGCESTERVAITVVINTIPSAPNAVAQAFCNTATVADLVPSGATYNWYDAATGGTALTTATALTATTYYVSQTANGCESTRTAVVVTLNTTTAPTAVAQNFCGNALVANLTATGANLKWYDVATNGSALASNTALASGTYYVSQTVNNCESTRTEVAVTVNNTAAPTASAQTFCSSATVANLVATGTTLNWYDVATGGTALTASTALATGIYYVSQTANGCESSRTAVTVTITTAATPTGAATQNVFGAIAADATIEDINVSGTGIVWYNSEADATAGTNPIAPGTVLVSGNTYYAVSVVGTCRSTALAVTVTVTLGTEEFDIQALKYYPNPVVDVLTIRYSQNITAVQVFDIAGRSILSNKENATEITVNFNDLPAAVYIIKVTTETASGEFKVVKK